MTRLKAFVDNPVEKSGDVRPFYALEQIEPGLGRIAPGTEVEERLDETAVLHRPGDVRFGKLRPYLAKSLYMTDHGHGSGELLVLRPRSGSMHGRFLHYLTLSKPFIEWATATSYGVKMPRTSWEALSSYPTDPPSLEEQQRIADYLDAETARIDERMYEDRHVRELLLERPWSHFAELVAESGAPEVPLRRALVRLSDGPFGSAFTSGDYSNDGAAVVRLGNIGFAEYRGSDQAFIPLHMFELFRRHEVIEGDILIAGLGDERNHAGRCCVAPDLGPAIVKGKCFVASLDTDTALPDYVAFYLSSALGRAAVGEAARGSTRTMINLEIAKSSLIALPSIGEQAEIVKTVAATRDLSGRLIAEVDQQLLLLQEHRQALITQAVTQGTDGFAGGGVMTAGRSVQQSGGDGTMEAMAADRSTVVIAGTEVDRARLVEVCERYGVAELLVFGSVARGDARPDSDLDLLYVLAPGRHLGFSINRLEDELSELFGRPVDLVSKAALHRAMRDEVLAEARELYAA